MTETCTVHRIDLSGALVYGDDAWAKPAHREANAVCLPPVGVAEVLPGTGHFALRGNPAGILAVIDATLARLDWMTDSTIPRKPVE